MCAGVAADLLDDVEQGVDRPTVLRVHSGPAMEEPASRHEEAPDVSDGIPILDRCYR